MIWEEDTFRTIVALAALAPSVHNIQPARFRFTPTGIELFEDRRRGLRIGDPHGADSLKSLGAAAEGCALAASALGLRTEISRPSQSDDFPLRCVAQLHFAPGGHADPLQDWTHKRASWRGMLETSDESESALTRLEETLPDVRLVRDRHGKRMIAEFYDDVSLEVLRGRAYRLELLSWMRLHRTHPDFARDGLNADAMSLSEFEARAAAIVLSDPAFVGLDFIGLAAPLISEQKKVESAAAIALFHCAEDEPPFQTGRRFYRLWLELEQAGLAACPMSVLADVPTAAHRLMRDFSVPGARTLVSALRIGKRPAGAGFARARLPLDELIIT
jgi:nitroreductase